MNFFYRLLADFLVIIHFIWILFMLWGFLKTIIAIIKNDKKFLSRFILRTVHLAGILYVGILIFIHKPCPLTIWEIKLRVLSGIKSYAGSFIIHYIENLVYPDVPAWVVEIPSIIVGSVSCLFYIIFPPFSKKK